MHGPVTNPEESILIDAALPNARETWLRSRDLGKTVILFNAQSSHLTEEIRATHRHREMGDNMLMVPLKTVRLADQPDWINDIIERVQPFTLTRAERVAALCNAIEYIVRCKVPGDIVECGVWRGGSMMAAALALQHFGETRTLWLYDTFDGMTAPADVDRTAHTGEAAADIMARVNDGSTAWCRSRLEEVKANIGSIVGSAGILNNVYFVKGDVLQTVPNSVPHRIALLRLDTDWYASTKHELAHLYPRLESMGVLIIDDYGHWLGARKAVDEWMTDARPNVCLTRTDYSCRMAVKP